MSLTPSSASISNQDQSAAPRRRPMRAFIAAGVAALLALAGVVALTSPASADPVTGTVGGTVDIDGTPVGFLDVQITAWRLTEQGGEFDAVQEGGSQTLADGSFSFGTGGMPAGDYAFQFGYSGALPNILGDFLGGAYTLEEAIADHASYFQTIGDGADVDVSHTMTTGSTVSGSVTNAGHVGLTDETVSLWREGTDSQTGDPYWGDVWATATTSAGSYGFDSLPPGCYTMKIGGGSSSYSPEFWPNTGDVFTPDMAPPFCLTTHQDLVADETLAVGVKVAGVVTNSGKAKLNGVLVTLYAQDSNLDWQKYKSGVTITNGAFSILGAKPGIHYTLGYDAGSTYLPQYWKAKPTLETANGFTPMAGKVLPPYPAVMVRSASIAGTLFGQGNSLLPTADVSISACKVLTGQGLDCNDSYGTVVYNDSTGAYTVGGLSAGTYSVHVDYIGTDNWRGEYYNDKRTVETATTFTVATGAAVTGRNIVLDDGARILGNVGSAGGSVDGAIVRIYDPQQYFDDSDFIKETVTQPDGDYSLNGLELGDYIVKAFAPDGSGVADQWFPLAYTAHDADVVPVDSYAGFGGINFNLPDSATIEGTITTTTSDPLIGSYLTLERILVPGGFRSIGWADTSTDVTGHYSFGDLPPGTYVVRAEAGDTGGTDGFVGRYFDAASGLGIEGATQLTIAASDDQTIDFSLDAGGTYTGIVTDGTTPLEGVEVYTEHSDTITDAAGAFTLTGLDPGAHTLTFDTTALSGPYLSQVDVDAPAVTLNGAPVDLGTIVIGAPSTIDGVLIGTDGKPIKNALVIGVTIDDLQDPQSVAGALTDAAGRFSIGDLPDVPVYLYVPSAGAKYDAQYAGGGDEWGQSDPVTFSHPGAHAFREIHLVNGGQVTGVVKNKSTGKVVKGIRVDVGRVLPSGDVIPYSVVSTNSKGIYTVAGLEPGTYSVWFNADQEDVGVAYSSQRSTVFVPDRATVKVNATLTPWQRVTGTVTKTGGAKLADILVTSFAKDGPDFTEGGAAVTDENGNYTLYLAPGQWVLYFTDQERRVAPAYLGGAPGTDTATVLTVAKSALAGRNLVMSPADGSVSFDISGTAEPDPAGYLMIERLDGLGNVIATDYVYGDCQCETLNDLMPITNLADGDYRMTIFGYSLASLYGGEYAPETVTFTISGALLTLGPVMLSGLHNYTSFDFPKPVPGFEPILSAPGTPQVGNILSVIDGTWDGPVTENYYQWLRDGKPIAGATSQAYELQPGDAGAHISVKVGVSNADLPFPNYALVLSMAPSPLPGNAPIEAGQAAVMGAPRVNSVLTAKLGSWDVPGLTFNYQWYRYDTFLAFVTPIAGATGSTYKVTAADLGDLVGVIITTHRTGFANGFTDVSTADVVTPTLAVKVVTAPKVTATDEVNGMGAPNPGWHASFGTYSPATIPAILWKVFNADGTVQHTFSGSADFRDSDYPGVGFSTDRVVAEVQAIKPGYTTTVVTVNARLGQAGYAVEPTPPGSANVGAQVVLDESAAVTLPNSIPVNGVKTTYQWYSGNVKISGATKPTYTPVAANAGKNLYVIVIVSAPGYLSDDFRYDVTTSVGAPPPIVAGTVTFSGLTALGVPALGRTVTAVPTGWAPAPTAYTYVWKRNGIAITGATKASYLVGAADLGAALSVSVTGTRAGHAPASLLDVVIGFLADTEPLQSKTAPVILPVAHVGVKITTTSGTWDLTPTSYSYQWYVNDQMIVGATASSYTPIPTDAGENITVEVTAKRAGYQDSSPVATDLAFVDLGAAVKATRVPGLTVAGKTVKSLKLGTTLSATAGTWPVAALQLGFQWQVSTDNGVSWSNISGATTKTLFLKLASAGDPDFAVGNSYRFRVTPAQRAGYLDSAPITSGVLKALS